MTSSTGRNNVEDIYPLSPLQEGLLFHTLYTPESGVYFQQLRFRFDGTLDAAAWERAWRRVVERHAVLRTAFAWQGRERPLQVVLKRVSVPWQELDWRGLPESEQSGRLKAFLDEDRRRGFDLSRAPLLRMTLVRLSGDANEFVCSHHHLLIDGWSTSNLLRELFAFYGRGAAAAPAPPPRRYKDYIAWLERQDMAKAEQFWRAHLAGFSEPTTLPGARGASSGPEGGGRQEKFETYLDEATTARLQALARRSEVTLNTLVTGAWALLLSRYGGEDDVVFGVTVSGRPAALEGVEAMVGLFINTLPLRVRTPPDAQLVSWLRELQVLLLDLREHEYSPLVKVQGWSEVPPGTQLFESMVVFENYPVDLTRRDLSTRLGVRDVRSIERSSFPLGLVAAPGPRILLQIGYDAERFDPHTVAQMMGHLRALLEGVAENPHRRLSDIPMLTAEEQRRLLAAWNETAKEYPPDATLHGLFEEQVAASPDSAAISYEGGRLTYGDLDSRAEKLAARLRRLGVGPESRVGVCAERSPEMVVALLGILKAGAAYVPLDPGLPEGRLRFMAEDAGVSALLAQGHLAARVEGCAARVLILDATDSAGEAGGDGGRRFASPDDLAYVIYTSGSTGRPKGVMVSHRAICNTLLWRRERFALGADDRVLLTLSFSFDASVWQIFGALVSGATLVLARPAAYLDSAHLVEKIVAESVTVTDFVPSSLQVFLDEPGVESCSSLRHVFSGGEALPPETRDKFFARLGAELHNVYGPTEAAIDAACWTCGRDDKRAVVPVGRAIANKRLYLLDAHMRPVPIGVPGEVYIGGAGLARGYLGRPALTAERFVPDPFSREAGARLYRTGDLARYLPDGNVEYVGRGDGQVKVRGFRIELGEVEAALSSHEGVRECAVVAHDDAQGGKRLIAYVTCGPELSPRALRKFLQAKLPGYMVPGEIVRLGRMPRTHTGKLDRRRLPAPEQPEGERGGEFTAPLGQVEELLAEMWAQVLGVARVGVGDNFFALGGHSLTAARIVSRVRESFKIELPLRAFFERPTVEGLAEAVEAAIREEQGVRLPPVVPAPRDRRPAMSFAQQRLWFLDRLVPGSPFYNMPGAFRLEGRLDRDALEGALADVVRRHEILRTTFAELDGRLVQVIAPELKLPLPLIDLGVLGEREHEAEARRLADEEAHLPFDLTAGPLVRATLLRLGEEDHRLLLTMHHIVSDGWSLGVLLGELAAFYRARVAGGEAGLPDMPVQYADYAEWQQSLLEGGALEAELNYWRRQLKDAPSVLELPTARPRPPAQSFSGATYSFVIPEDLTSALRALCRRETVTMFMLTLALFEALLSRYTGQEEIVVGTPVAGRSRGEVERLIGFFINTLVLRTDLSGDPTLRELAARVREVSLGAFAHQELPFEKLVEELHPHRDMSHTPLFQVMFGLQNTPVGALDFPRLRLSSMEVENRAAKFDLSLDLQESGGVLLGWFEYSTDLFDEAAIARTAGHFLTLAAAAVQNPDRRLSELPLLTDGERRLFAEWNDTRAERPAGLCVHGLFERQAALTPDSVAVVCGDRRLTYGELNRRANRIAHRLRGHGVGPDVFVAVSMERSVGMVAALLGVLKAGGAYLPLDPAYPRERLAFMIEDARPQVLLTTDGLAARLPQTGARLVLIGEGGEGVGAESEENLDLGVDPSALAYVIYTSGSTGRPKGVMIPRAGLLNAYLAWEESYGLRRDGVASHLQMASFSFDVFAGDLTRALCSGAKLVICPHEILLEPSSLYRLMLDERVDSAEFVPAVLRVLVQHLEETGRSLDFLRLLVAGSDSWYVKEYADIRRFCGPHTRLINSYGVTESTIDSTFYEGDVADLPVENLIPIGRPFANTRTYVLDRNMRRVPVGVPGEVYLGGAGLARGYLGRPALTAERFVPDPFSREAGARLYRTGDLARYLPGGNVEMLGRADSLVKVRGFRVELGEVEAVLGAHPALASVVVLALADAHGEKRLVAYCVCAAGAEASARGLREFMQGKMPAYMVPSLFVFLEAMPLSPNGKIDRKRLPAPDDSQQERRQTYVAPRDQIEAQLCEVWEALLGAGRVGITDNFFDLGGHSLLALRLMAEVQKRFNRTLPLATLFENGTVKHLAGVVREAVAPDSASPLVAIQPDGARRPVFFVHVGSGNVLCYLDLARHLGPDQPFYGLQDPSLAGGAAPFESIEDMAALYVRHVRSAQQSGPYLIGGWSFGGLVAFEMARQLVAQGQEVALLAVLDSGTPEMEREIEQRMDDAALLAILAHEMYLPVASSDLRPLDPEERLKAVASQMEAFGIVFEDPRGYLRRQLEIFKYRNRATLAYDPEPYAGRVALFVAEEAGEGEEYKREAAKAHLDLSQSWGRMATQGVDVLYVPGSHHEIAREPNVRELARLLRGCIDRALEEGTVLSGAAPGGA